MSSSEKSVKGTVIRKKNGKVEFLRFYFCMSVFFFHCLKYTKGLKYSEGQTFSFFSMGALGVEFFFLLSGLLMAKHIKKKNDNSEPVTRLGKETFLYVKGKFMSILPYHFLAFVILTAEVIIINKYSISKALGYIVDSIPSFFLIHKSGVAFKEPNSVEWYLSVMLLVMMLLYPICRKYYDMLVYCIAPLGGLMLAGYFKHQYHKLTGVSTWTGFMYKSVLRGLLEIALGAVAYELCLFIQKWCDNNRKRLMITMAEIALYAGVTYIMVSTLERDYEIYALMLLFCALPISFSGCTYGCDLFNNRVCYFLGKISLPIYLIQLFSANISAKYLGNYGVDMRIIFMTITTILMALLLMAVVEGRSFVKVRRGDRKG